MMSKVKGTIGRDKKRKHNFNQKPKWMRPSGRVRNRSEAHRNNMRLEEVYWIHPVLDRDLCSALVKFGFQNRHGIFGSAERQLTTIYICTASLSHCRTIATQ
jgi:hypothetical protein